MDFVIVASFPSIVDLSMAKACLQSHGIKYYIRNEHSAQIKESYNVMLGGIKLLVKENDAQEATRILTEAGFIKQEQATTVPFWEKLSLPQRFLVFLAAFILVIVILYLVQVLSGQI